MYARKYKRTVRRNRCRRRRQYRRRSTIYRRKRNIKRRSLKYRYQSEKFVSNATWSSSYANKPVVVTTSPSDWGGWGNMKNRYMEYKITCYKLEFLPRQSPAFPKIVEDGTAIDLPWMWMRYADRPLSTTTSLEAYTDVRKSAMRGYKKYIVKYPKYNWNDSAANLYVARARWLPTSTSHAYYGIALQCATDLSTLYDIKLTAYVKFKSPIMHAPGETITVLNMPSMKLQKRSIEDAGGEYGNRTRRSVLDLLTN